jgi:hypothetical protein
LTPARLRWRTLGRTALGVVFAPLAVLAGAVVIAVRYL